MTPILKDIFKSTIKSLEILYVLEGAKPSARIMVSEKDEAQVEGFVSQKGLSYVKSNFKVVKQDKDKVYSDKGLRVPIDSQTQGYFFAYISKDMEKSLRARELEEKGMHRELGLMLGYPSCCSQFFFERFSLESQRSNDFTLAALDNSKGITFPYQNNIAARHFDHALLSHFPCSFNCPKSLEIAKRNLSVIDKHDRELALKMAAFLQTGVLYTEDKGVFLLRNMRIEGNNAYYGEVTSNTKNELYDRLMKSGEIKLIGGNIVVEGLIIKKAGLMNFR